VYTVPPLTHIWCVQKDLNLHARRHPLLRRTCLPFHHEHIFGAPNRNRTCVFRFAGGRLGHSAIGASFVNVVATGGVEPPTLGSSGRRSTVELHRHMVKVDRVELSIEVSKTPVLPLHYTKIIWSE
jgi:hypothetical protein